MRQKQGQQSKEGQFATINPESLRYLSPLVAKSCRVGYQLTPLAFFLPWWNK